MIGISLNAFFSETNSAPEMIFLKDKDDLISKLREVLSHWVGSYTLRSGS